jgi:hypothetical protein
MKQRPTHLGVIKPARVLCLAYADRIEILSEPKAREQIAFSIDDIKFGELKD